MHILMLSDVFFPRINGVSTSIQTFVHSFLHQGHKVTLIAPRYPYEVETEFEVIRIPSLRLPLDPEDRLMRLGAIKKLAPELSRRQFDLIHIQTPFVAHYGGLYLGKKLGLKVVTSYHTFFEAYFEKYLTWIPSPWLRAFARAVSRRQCNQVDGVISPSQPMLEKLREYGIVTEAVVIGTGLRLDQFQVKNKNNFRLRHDIPAHAPLLLYVGRVAHEKNIAFLFDMFAKVLGGAPDARLLIAGEGPALVQLRRRARQMGFGQQILFTGYLERTTELIACYHASDVFVFASETETQGLVLLEAMACRLPVVSTANMGTKDVLRHGQGCLVAPLERDAFAAEVLSIVTDPVKAGQLAESGPAYVQQWSTDAKAGEMLDFYRRLVPQEAAMTAAEARTKISPVGSSES
jgi:glycosyltransferase involved in cell wall biosynthesis